MRSSILSLLIIVLLTGCSSNDEEAVMIYFLAGDLLVLSKITEYFYNEGPQDEDILKEAEGALIVKVLLIRKLEPKLSNLRGEPIKGLCAAVMLSKNSQFGKAQDDPKLGIWAKEYLAGIVPELKKIADEHKETVFVDADCPL